MKNLILPSENQVKIDIEKFLEIRGIDTMNINELSFYLYYVKGLITEYFRIQNVKLNSEDFFKIYHLYTLSPIYFSFVKL
jgi:hypothetical protein